MAWFWVRPRLERSAVCLLIAIQSGTDDWVYTDSYPVDPCARYRCHVATFIRLGS
jgi:hypothetical protein